MANFDKKEISKGWILVKMRFQKDEFLGKWDFKKTSFVCVWDFKVFDFWVFSFWKTCCNLTSYRESQYTKVHLYFTCNKSELAILEFTLLVPLFSNSLLPLSNLDFTGEFCQIMIAQIVWYARKELNKKKVEIFHQRNFYDEWNSTCGFFPDFIKTSLKLSIQMTRKMTYFINKSH